jgi:nicotinate-nucleotide adenylyltransferase
MIKDTVIAVCGGAFNPPTMAHYRLYQATKDAVYIDRFIYLPVSLEYPKEGLMDDHHRLQMLRLMTANDPSVIIEDHEINLQTFKGTYHSLRALEKKYEATLLFVLGTDQAQSLETWIEAEKLLTEFQFVVFERQVNWETLLNQSPFLKRHQSRFLKVSFNQPIASSDYRKTKDSSLLHPAVNAYIKRHQLYEDAA